MSTKQDIDRIELLQGTLDLLRRIARKNSALNRSPGSLRQCILRMTGLQHSGHTGGSHGGVVHGHRAQPCYGPRVRRIPGHRPKVACQGIDCMAGQALEESSGRRGETNRKVEAREPVETSRQGVDRVVLGGEGAVPSGTGHFQLVAGVELLAGLHRIAEPLTVLHLGSPRVGVDHVRGSDQIGPVFG